MYSSTFSLWNQWYSPISQTGPTSLYSFALWYASCSSKGLHLDVPQYIIFPPSTRYVHALNTSEKFKVAGGNIYYIVWAYLYWVVKFLFMPKFCFLPSSGQLGSFLWIINKSIYSSPRFRNESLTDSIISFRDKHPSSVLKGHKIVCHYSFTDAQIT